MSGDFVHDDIPTIVTNNDVVGHRDITNLLYNDFWGLNIRKVRSDKSYRPLTILTYR